VSYGPGNTVYYSVIHPELSDKDLTDSCKIGI